MKKTLDGDHGISSIARRERDGAHGVTLADA
jgi:hypothetical protein